MLVAGWSRATLDAASQLLAGADSLRKDAAQKVHLAASFTIAEFLLPGWLHAFAKVDASVRFSVDVANSRRVMERVLARDVDMGFVEDEIDDDRLSSAVVARDELVIVVAPKHPWARRDEVPARALAETALVLREEGSGTRQTLDRALASLGLSRSVPPLLELGSTAAVKQAVRSGAGPAVLSRLAVGTELEAGALCVVRVPEVELGRSLHAVWTGPAPGSPASARLLGRLAQPAGTAPALRSR
ncbi:MAG: LysR substrate-binding domain-containing protein [Acidimicrobiia bacterium]